MDAQIEGARLTKPLSKRTEARRTPALRSRHTLFRIVFLSALPLAAQPLSNTAPLTLQGDLSVQMVAGIDRFFDRETAAATQARDAFWKMELSGDRAAYEKSVQPNRERFARMIGVIDPRVPAPD